MLLRDNLLLIVLLCGGSIVIAHCRMVLFWLRQGDFGMCDVAISSSGSIELVSARKAVMCRCGDVATCIVVVY